jgi:endogenous inhibitor of DNA gyrase (YacG/DUF329 family)
MVKEHKTSRKCKKCGSPLSNGHISKYCSNECLKLDFGKIEQIEKAGSNQTNAELKKLDENKNKDLDDLLSNAKKYRNINFQSEIKPTPLKCNKCKSKKHYRRINYLSGYIEFKCPDCGNIPDKFYIDLSAERKFKIYNDRDGKEFKSIGVAQSFLIELQDILKNRLSTYIYLIQAEDNELIKIGFSNNVKRRMKILSNSSPAKLKVLRVIKADSQYESFLHNMFREYRLHGEWFQPHSNIVKFVNDTKDICVKEKILK